jgi:hypothetical protein
VEEKTATSGTEVQLGFEFLREAKPSAAPVPPITPPPRPPRTGGRSRGLTEILGAARTALIEAPLSDVSTQLLALFEFCEATLTRVLDVLPTRPGVPFSIEEYRSLRGIGQAQWLLAEAQRKRETKPEPRRGKKTQKKTRNAER